MDWELLVELCSNILHFKRSCFDHFQASLRLYLLVQYYMARQQKLQVHSKFFSISKNVLNHYPEHYPSKENQNICEKVKFDKDFN